MRKHVLSESMHAANPWNGSLPSSDQKVSYRIHTTPDGIVTKVEVEKKVKGKKVWVELGRLVHE